MKGSRWLVALVGIVALGVGFELGSAVGQQSPPMDNKGLDAKVESTIDLAPDMPGYQLRIRTITFEPGGVAGFHSHKQRPAFAYILQGDLTELRQSGGAAPARPPTSVSVSGSHVSPRTRRACRRRCGAAGRR